MHSQSSKPLLVYDNDCDFCRYWIVQWQHITGDRVDYAPYQEVASQFPETPLSAFESSVQLILENGRVLSGAEAVLRALNSSLLLWCYYHLPGFATVSETVYRLIAQHRPFFSAMTRWLWGPILKEPRSAFRAGCFCAHSDVSILLPFSLCGCRFMGLSGVTEFYRRISF